MPSGRPAIIAALISIVALQSGCASAPVAEGPPESLSMSAERGRSFAELRCAECHSIDRATISPRFEAPAFRRLKRADPGLWQTTLEGIGRGVHDSMPTFNFRQSDIDDLRAYIATLP